MMKKYASCTAPVGEYCSKHGVVHRKQGGVFKDEIKRLRRTGIPRCQKCGKDYVRITAHGWKPGCKCVAKGVRLLWG